MNTSNKLALIFILLIIISVISFKFLGKKNATNEREMVYYSAEFSADEEVEGNTESNSGDE